MEMDKMQVVWKNQKELRCGYTTGSCAAAAAKAAAAMLFSGEEIRQVSLMTPKGIELYLEVEKIQRENESVSCAIQKDSGDDPDVTNGIFVYAKVTKKREKGVTLDGGIGVGRFTRKVLEQEAGEAAINKVPRQMIREAVQSQIEKYDWDGGADVLVYVPQGVEIAKKTFNPRLGIEGGISVLGTSGIFWCYQLLAGKCLKDESRKVYVQLVNHNLEGARHAVSMIVGRDTGNLSEAGVTKAAVETVAENTSDGVIAPLIFMLIGGVPLGFFYKAVNTMDSMVGYKNEKYLHFGRFAAKMDDVWNYIPSRISALLMIASAWIFRMDYKRAWAVWKRDRRKHASPNSAQTEAVCAGALQVQLAGDAYYFGKLYPKETIGDDVRPIEPEDILRAGNLMDGTALLTLLVFGLLKYCMILM